MCKLTWRRRKHHASPHHGRFDQREDFCLSVLSLSAPWLPNTLRVDFPRSQRVYPYLWWYIIWWEVGAHASSLTVSVSWAPAVCTLSLQSASGPLSGTGTCRVSWPLESRTPPRGRGKGQPERGGAQTHSSLFTGRGWAARDINTTMSKLEGGEGKRSVGRTSVHKWLNLQQLFCISIHICIWYIQLLYLLHSLIPFPRVMT